MREGVRAVEVAARRLWWMVDVESRAWNTRLASLAVQDAEVREQHPTPKCFFLRGSKPCPRESARKRERVRPDRALSRGQAVVCRNKKVL
eukprot:1470027-Rhodomonas_salina.3